MAAKEQPGQGLDLKKFFPNNDVCALRDDDDVKTWRIRQVQPRFLNELRNWLETGLQSVAIAWIHVEENGGILSDELLAHRLGLIPIVADPLRLKPGDEGKIDEFNAETSLVFKVDVRNDTDKFLQVFSGSLGWEPMNSQVDVFKSAVPMVEDEAILLTVLEPGASLRLIAYATVGTKRQHAKWAAALTFFKSNEKEYISSPARASPVLVETLLAEDRAAAPKAAKKKLAAACEPCAEKFCYHFTIERIGGLSFENIGDQMVKNFKWPSDAPPSAYTPVYTKP